MKKLKIIRLKKNIISKVNQTIKIVKHKFDTNRKN